LKRPAVKFRNKVYIGNPRHKDAIDLAFAGMTQHQKFRACNRIADGKETILFGWVDGCDNWEPDPRWQSARMIMYGFD
jgi:hypothetical protein